MSRPNFAAIPYSATPDATSYANWCKSLEAEFGRPIDAIVWDTMEKIPVKPLYTEADTAGMEHLKYQAGIAPFLRGPYATMYSLRMSFWMVPASCS